MFLPLLQQGSQLPGFVLQEDMLCAKQEANVVLIVMISMHACTKTKSENLTTDSCYRGCKQDDERLCSRCTAVPVVWRESL